MDPRRTHRSDDGGVRRGIKATRDGRFRVALPAEERAVLASLPAQLGDALDAGEETLFRLFPPAFADDAEADAEYRRLVGRSLEDGKRAALAELERTADATELTEAELSSWLGAIESLRLALGTQLDVTEETYLTAIDPNDPDLPRHALYHWLSWLQEEVVAALSTTLP